MANDKKTNKKQTKKPPIMFGLIKIIRKGLCKGVTVLRSKTKEGLSLKNTGRGQVRVLQARLTDVFRELKCTRVCRVCSRREGKNYA